MIIRPANKFDQPSIIRMLNNFKHATPIPKLAECNNHLYISLIISNILRGRGLLYLAEKDNIAVGMIMGYITPSIWDPSILVLNELAFWVEPEHRNTTAAYRLLKEYTEAAKILKSQDRILFYTMTKLSNSPNLSYDKLGYKLVEENWVGE